MTSNAGYFTYQNNSSTHLAPPSVLSGGSLSLSPSAVSDPFRDPSLDAPRPPIPTRPSEIHRQLVSALDDELPPPKVLAREESGPRKAHVAPPKQDSPGGLLSQFRTGSGWFAPVVPPSPKLTREERDAQEAFRIKKLREEGKGKRRPGFIKRMSSGVEMLGFGGSKGSKNGTIEEH